MGTQAIADAETTPKGEAQPDAQDQNTAATPTPDGAKATPESGQGQPKDAPTLLTSEEPTAPVVPESYDLKLPETTYLDATVTERVTALAKAAKLTDAKDAQAILEAIHGESLTAVETYQKAVAKDGAIWKETVKELEKSALADKEIGGTPDKLQKSVTHAKAVLDKHATEEFRSWLSDTGQGSHPEVIRFLTRVARALGEDQMVQGGTKPSQPKTRQERLYPQTAQ